jgi:hypothetical protein
MHAFSCSMTPAVLYRVIFCSSLTACLPRLAGRSHSSCSADADAVSTATARSTADAAAVSTAAAPVILRLMLNLPKAMVVVGIV